ncbi:beta-ketoacyl-ACP synthase III [Desulfitispora alkaliphila]|uniref:beta-ketoacyl-ACP synthase III n=1 Tax=Desulfitispora alkaliphila TaxID=622674 RepID=UPI003D1D3CAF
MKSVGITGLGSSLPENIVTNRDIANYLDTNDEWIVNRTGISERRKAEEHILTSDICAEAAQKALDDAGLKPEEIDLIILATMTPDLVFPATACMVQEKIGAVNAAAMDLEAACTGFIYGIATGQQFVATGMYRNVLVIGGELMSRIVDWEDRNTCILFGDGAGAAVLSPVEDGCGIMTNYLGSDGSGLESLYVPAGGAKRPTCEETVKQREHFVRMNGSEVFKFAVRVMGDASIKALEKAGLGKEDIDFLVPHQANIRIIEAATKRLGLSKDKVIANIDKYGNMSAASIPVALEEAVTNNRIKKGDIVLMVGFGGGLTWGATVMKWNKD